MTISGVKIKKTDGTWVGGTSPAPDVQDFTSSGTWTKPEGARLVRIELIGAGGGSFGSPSAGGFGGSYVSQLLNAESLGATETVTIGAGVLGSNGGDTLFAGITARGGYWAPAAQGLPSSRPAEWHPTSDGGWGASSTSSTALPQQNSDFGGGGGGRGAGGSGGLLAASVGALKAGDGGAAGQPGKAPGGGAGYDSNSTGYAGGRGAARITTYF